MQPGILLAFLPAYLEVGAQLGVAVHQEAEGGEGVRRGVPCLLVVVEAVVAVLLCRLVYLSVAGEVAAVVPVLTPSCLVLQPEGVAGVVGGEEGRAWTGFSEQHQGVVVAGGEKQEWTGFSE